ncbi:hypothetical protein FQN52_006757 [Onygenales sp. PD_12]|nr:hypothetical protein FQN53_003706 [Emmonsiellopsis sp. PD_33]KAK2788218.1 hypothetical protein FQN52_006757 [Onygenales sp. PD_12]KAK2803880.1 hypothetical protein FQN51_002765 [Onygenales sp. PD_10]
MEQPPRSRGSETLPSTPPNPSEKAKNKHSVLPLHNGKSRSLFRIHTAGESGRSGVHPIHFLKVCFKSTTPVSMVVNVLWPFVPAAIAIHFARPDLHLWIFALNYIAMVPTANLLGFAGNELARKLPKVWGILVETTLSSVVELVLLMVLISNDEGNNLIPVIHAAILGSILANLLLCLGLCFFLGGLRRDEQQFHSVISETGSGLLLVAGFALLIPSAFFSALSGSTTEEGPFTAAVLLESTHTISRGTAVILLCAFLMFLFFNLRSHHSIYDEVLELDEERDEDRADEIIRSKLTMTECLIAVAVALACVSISAVLLVATIPAIVERGVPDNFMGLILVPLVEKAAEHLVAIDEAWDNQINFALFHCLGPSIQTALFNAPLVVLVGWGLGKDMDLNFEIFMIVLVVLSILVVGNFLRDGKSNYLEGGLLVMVYLIIAVTSWYYPNPHDGTTNVQLPPSEHGGGHR